MTQYGWPYAPAPVREQVQGLAADFEALLGDALVGVYLHGSLALGCFNPRRSDVDLLVVTKRSLQRRDLATHVWIVRRAGIALIGPSTERVFPDVPHSDYADSLLGDLAWCRTVRNLDYGVLSASRIWATLSGGGLQSKDTGACWALERAPAQFRPLVRNALARYRGDASEATLDEPEVRAYIAYVEERVREGAA